MASVTTIFEGDYAPLLKSQPELLEMEDHAEPIKPYMDVVLRTSRAKYLAFVKDLIERRLVQVTLDPKEHVTIFFVKKKDHSLRMVVDSRRPNRLRVVRAYRAGQTLQPFVRGRLDEKVCLPLQPGLAYASIEHDDDGVFAPPHATKLDRLTLRVARGFLAHLSG